MLKDPDLCRNLRANSCWEVRWCYRETMQTSNGSVGTMKAHFAFSQTLSQAGSNYGCSEGHCLCIQATSVCAGRESFDFTDSGPEVISCLERKKVTKSRAGKTPISKKLPHHSLVRAEGH